MNPAADFSVIFGESFQFLPPFPFNQYKLKQINHIREENLYTASEDAFINILIQALKQKSPILEPKNKIELSPEKIAWPKFSATLKSKTTFFREDMPSAKKKKKQFHQPEDTANIY